MILLGAIFKVKAVLLGFLKTKVPKAVTSVLLLEYNTQDQFLYKVMECSSKMQTYFLQSLYADMNKLIKLCVHLKLTSLHQQVGDM